MTDKSSKPRIQAVSSGARSDDPQQGQTELAQKIDNLDSQNVLLRMQLAQVAEAIVADNRLLRESADSLRAEVKRLQIGSAQGAMAALFSKFFRQCIEQLNHLDALLATGCTGERSEAEKIWISAIEILRDGFTQLLCDWGCTPIVIHEGETQFDPEIHESVPSAGIEIPPGTPANVIFSVCRRGWKLNNIILQFPQVIVA